LFTDSPLLLANVHVRHMLSCVHLSSETLVHPTQAVAIFGSIFYGIWYLGHPLISMENFMEIVPGEPLCRES